MAHVADLEKDKFDSNGFVKVAVQGSGSYQNVYNYVHDGSQWRFQLSDANGKAINLDHTYYTASEITAMGSSTDINLWLSAYNDSMLIKKYVSSYDDQYEEIVYYQHPSLTSGKCLKLIYQYSTENSVKVVKSIFASVSDWTFESSISGSVAITNGTITSPDPNSTIAVGTDICTLSITDSTAGPVTIALSGTSASLYRLSDGTSTGSTLTHDATKSYVLETASDFSGSSYSHSVTITVTGSEFGVTDSVNIATTNTVTSYTFTNLKYATLSNTGSMSIPVAVDFSDSWSISFWYNAASFTSASYYDAQYVNLGDGTSVTVGSYQRLDGFLWQYRGSSNYVGVGDPFRLMTFTNIDDGNWHHICFVFESPTPALSSNISSSDIANYVKIYYDNSVISSSSVAGTANWAPTKAITELRFGDAVTGQNESPYSFDDICIYESHALTSTEVGLLYNSGTPTNPMATSGLTSPDHFYQFEDASNQTYETITDANSGTATGITTNTH